MEQIGNIIKFDNSVRVVIEQVCAYGKYRDGSTLYIYTVGCGKLYIRFDSKQERDSALLKLDEILS